MPLTLEEFADVGNLEIVIERAPKAVGYECRLRPLHKDRGPGRMTNLKLTEKMERSLHGFGGTPYFAQEDLVQVIRGQTIIVIINNEKVGELNVPADLCIK